MDASPQAWIPAFDGKERSVRSSAQLQAVAGNRYSARKPEREFRVLFCERFDCPPAEFENRAFRELLYWHAKPLAPLIHKLNPEFFEEDFKFIQYLGDASCRREAKANAADFKDANHARRNFLRTGLRIRVSGMKATKLAHRLFAHGS